MRHTRHTLLWPLLLLGALSPAGHAAPPVPPAAKAPPPLTLARALSALPPPATGVWLAVGADKATLPAGTAPPPADASVTALANAFGDETREFGAVTALVPFSRVLLNPNPGPPDLSADLNPLTAIKMLAASLDDAQWKLLTSESGLGLTDLSDDTQKLLFHALFYNGELWVASQDPAQEKRPKGQRTDTRNVSDQIDSVRLRLGQTARIYLHDKKGKTIYFSGPPAEPAHLQVWRPPYPPSATRNNVTLRAVVSNTPKSSALPLTNARFQPPVSLAGAKTVADLVGRLAATTHTELYADPHYASRLLTVIGPASEAPAADVLKALALAVAGTYRQVGPAYVLTDDLEGVGTRRKRLQNWENSTSAGDSKLSDQAGAVLLKQRISQARTLPTFGDRTAITPQQMTGLKDDSVVPGTPSEDENFPYTKLTPAQKGYVRQTAEAYNEFQATRPAPGTDDDPPQEPDPTGAVDLIPKYKVQMLVPTVEGPVETRLQNWAWSLFWPGLATVEAMQAERAATAPVAATPADTRPPAPPLLPLLRSRPRRAVVGHPTTPAAVDALVAAMQKVGLNELWLDVFSEGKSHLADKGTDILTEALAKTKGTGIAVYADLSLLPWGNTPPKESRDLDILGQDSRQTAIANHDRSHEGDYDAAGRPIPYEPPPVFVSPVSPQVQKTLADTVRGLASRPGVAGFVWEDALRGDDLGYTPSMRLAFLRAFQADPVDITQNDYPRADVSLPTFDDKAADDTLTKHWDEARQGANGYFLTLLRQAVPSASAKPVLIGLGSRDVPLLVSWDDPRQTPPPLRTLFGGSTDDLSLGQAVSEVTKQGRLVLVRVPVKDPANADALARDLQEALTLPAPSPKAKAAWDGYVLDFQENRFTDSTDPLSDLVRAVTPAP